MGRYPYSTDYKWWQAPDTRSDALEEAKYYMWAGNPRAAYGLIVSLCFSLDKKGSSKYDESLEQRYTVPRFRPQ